MIEEQMKLAKVGDVVLYKTTIDQNWLRNGMLL